MVSHTFSTLAIPEHGAYDSMEKIIYLYRYWVVRQNDIADSYSQKHYPLVMSCISKCWSSMCVIFMMKNCCLPTLEFFSCLYLSDYKDNFGMVIVIDVNTFQTTASFDLTIILLSYLLRCITTKPFR